MAKKTVAPPRKKAFYKKPQYEGGTIALSDFISKNLVYPADAIAHNIQGEVHIKFDVNENGEVITAKIARGLNSSCDEEGLRVVKMLKYIPARNRGVHITTHHDIVIHFRLPKVSMPVAMQPQFTYTFIPAEKEPEVVAQEESKPIVFTWTVGNTK